jgi:RHS repeat-associated protein
MKARSLSTLIYINGTLVNDNISMDNYTTYPSGFIVVDPNGIYSKHYYIGTQRIASRIGDGTAVIFENKSKEMPELKKLQQIDMMHYFAKKGVKSIEFAKYVVPDLNIISDTSGGNMTSNGSGGVNPPKISIYYYHPDHLGTNTIVTDMAGNTYQYFLNLPFGETMAEQLGSGYFQNPYKFNGKELDAETGLYYYGARYYDPRTSVWLSVDQLCDRKPYQSSFTYCSDNPIIFIDPDGKSEGDFYITNKNKTISYDHSDEHKGDGKVYLDGRELPTLDEREALQKKIGNQLKNGPTFNEIGGRCVPIKEYKTDDPFGTTEEKNMLIDAFPGEEATPNDLDVYVDENSGTYKSPVGYSHSEGRIKWTWHLHPDGAFVLTDGGNYKKISDKLAPLYPNAKRFMMGPTLNFDKGHFPNALEFTFEPKNKSVYIIDYLQNTSKCSFDWFFNVQEGVIK